MTTVTSSSGTPPALISSSNNGKNLWEGHGLVASLMITTTFMPFFTFSRSLGEPIGLSSALRISACSSFTPVISSGRTMPARFSSGTFTSKCPFPYFRSMTAIAST